jgi:gluconokinase
LFCYALTGRGVGDRRGHSNGGITLRWAGETFAPDLVARGHADADVLELAARAPAGNNGLLMLPYVLSERAPLWDPDIAGAYLGIRAHHTRSHFVRAAIEGVCLQLSYHRGRPRHRCTGAIHPEPPEARSAPIFGAKSWRQRSPAPVHRGRRWWRAALGAAALGWYALGRASSLTEALAGVGGPRLDTRAETVAVTPLTVSAYAQLRASVRALIDDYDEVATMFASSLSSTR